MLNMNFVDRIYPDATQQQLMLDWLETCRKVYNQSLRELKDWLASRKSLVDRCSSRCEYIIPADAPFPSYQRQQDQLPKAKKKTQNWLRCILKFCKLQFVDCTTPGRHFKNAGLGFLDSKSTGSLDPLFILNSRAIPSLATRSNFLRLEQ